MNCSQLLERRAITNWERTTQSLKNQAQNQAEVRSEPRPWGSVKNSGSTSADRFFTHPAMPPTRWS
jgi:hypothetical protein